MLFLALEVIIEEFENPAFEILTMTLALNINFHT